jgi:uncharacterized FlaG/YvyC family protein
MEVHPLNRLDLSAPLNISPTMQSDSATNRQLVMAVQQVNQSELLGQDRELIYRRDNKTGKLVVQTVDRTSGNVLDQIPLEVLLRLQAESAQAAKRMVSPASTDLG